MEIVCPVCKTTAEMSRNDLEHPLTKTTCRNCETILLINPVTGKVDAHKTTIKDAHSLTNSGKGEETAFASFVSRRPQVSMEKDWTAVVVIAIVVGVLVAAGIYFSFSLPV